MSKKPSIGLGIMAETLLKSGYAVSGFDIAPAARAGA